MKDIRTVEDINIKEYDLEFKFQPKLTIELDKLNEDFTQNILNEIILWKVNRYAWFDSVTIELLNTLKQWTSELDELLTEQLLEKLLGTKGVRIAMASTILRFKNPSVYQIIDQRVYRIVYWVNMPTIKDKEASNVYIKYLKDLRSVCTKHNIPFEQSDRDLYALDKVINKGIKIKY